jgi:hypothetical protein
MTPNDASEERNVVPQSFLAAASSSWSSFSWRAQFRLLTNEMREGPVALLNAFLTSSKARGEQLDNLRRLPLFVFVACEDSDSFVFVSSSTALFPCDPHQCMTLLVSPRSWRVGVVPSFCTMSPLPLALRATLPGALTLSTVRLS